MNAGDETASIEGRDDGAAGLAHRKTQAEIPLPTARAAALVWMAAALAALVAWVLGEAFYEVIPAERVLQNISGNQVMIPNLATESVATTRNAALAFGVSGLCLAGFLGVAGGLARRSIPATLTAGMVGSVLGFILGAAVCLGLLPTFLHARYYYDEYELAISFAMHGVIWAPLGACAGLAFAIGRSRSGFMVRAILAGLSGALLGSIGYEILGAGVFPMANTSQPVSNWWLTRLLAQVLLAGMTALFLAVASRSRAPASPRS